eukprot:CAMPEP_0181295194 /NCGR_PEP_ID=MMETSP1101-20121128/4012_1 /TAXON_ID=46948 /ORGANISM="Rhodomonas abbreviata, Strain Caron Lab Isolate" /LENGTH=201 /DNA_ID=CAMNT_0023399919 /DNA_START=89 /DNA_END=694 /DNA_ORIENTATION=-
MLKNSTVRKRKFRETVDLQFCLQHYDPKKDKRFSGTVKLPCIPRPSMRVCVLGNAKHCAEAAESSISCMSEEELKSLGKNRKSLKRWKKKYHAFLASSSIIRMIPRLMAPPLGAAGKFPHVVCDDDTLASRVNEIKSLIKFKAHKGNCLAVAVGHVEMTEEELFANINFAINYLVSLLSKRWKNWKSIFLKSTMGKPERIL